MIAEQVIDELSKLNGVEAVALGGSRASDNADKKSDYDVYVYFSQTPDETERKELLERYCSEYEIGNHYWEYEDNCVLNDGIPMDIIYRSLKDFSNEEQLHKFLLSAKNGYSTCFLHNIITCNIIYDKTGDFTKIQQNLMGKYSDSLRKEIIERNMKLLHGVLPSYDMQIKKAVIRGDLVSINHRTAGFMESYFDVIFALNKMTHPGEKKLIKICLEQCKILPENFEENLNRLFTSMYSEYDFDALESIISELEKVVKDNL